MNTPSVPRVTRSRFGVLPDGTEVERVVLHAADGLEARIITYGASLQALLVPDAAGRRDDIVLGHDDVRGISRPAAVLRRDRRPLCQPHRRRALHARRRRGATRGK